MLAHGAALPELLFCPSSETGFYSEMASWHLNSSLTNILAAFQLLWPKLWLTSLLRAWAAHRNHKTPRGERWSKAETYPWPELLTRALTNTALWGLTAELVKNQTGEIGLNRKQIPSRESQTHLDLAVGAGFGGVLCLVSLCAAPGSQPRCLWVSPMSPAWWHCPLTCHG